MKINGRPEVSPEALEAFCRKWKVIELALFGSVLRDDFRPDSDIDVLVTFAEDSRPGFAAWIDMREELSRLLGRNVDLIERKSIEESRNPFRRHSILTTARVVYGGD